MNFAECRLRPLAKEDLATVLTWRNSERIRTNMYTDHLISWEEHLRWFAGLAEEAPARFLIFCRQEQPLGVVSFTNAIGGIATWGFYIGDEDAPQGSGSAMACLALRHAFEELRLCKLVGEVLAFNEASLAYHRKLGFVQEGVLSGHVLKNGQLHDVVTFGLHKEDWERDRQQLEERLLSRRSALKDTAGGGSQPASGAAAVQEPGERDE